MLKKNDQKEIDRVNTIIENSNERKKKKKYLFEIFNKLIQSETYMLDIQDIQTTGDIETKYRDILATAIQSPLYSNSNGKQVGLDQDGGLNVITVCNSKRKPGLDQDGGLNVITVCNPKGKPGLDLDGGINVATVCNSKGKPEIDANGGVNVPTAINPMYDIG